jgi:hypothetical protein
MRWIDLWVKQKPLSHLAINGAVATTGVMGMFYALDYFVSEKTLIDERLKPALQEYIDRHKSDQLADKPSKFETAKKHATGAAHATKKFIAHLYRTYLERKG